MVGRERPVANMNKKFENETRGFSDGCCVPLRVLVGDLSGVCCGRWVETVSMMVAVADGA